MFKVIVSNIQTFQLLRSVILDSWENKLPPDQWKVGLLKIIYKKGHLIQLGDNNRGIMLLEVSYKIIAKIVYSRLLPIAEKLYHESQSRFRPGRGCADTVFTVKIAMKKRREPCNKLG